jgi:hypothetical protein
MIRRAVDMSSGGPGEDRELESEAEMARKQVPGTLTVYYVPTLQSVLRIRDVYPRSRIRFSPSRIQG